VSTQTTLTTPASTASLQTHPPVPYGRDGSGGGGGLSYPSVPPPSLSSSLGSPTISSYYYYPGNTNNTREPASPVDGGYSPLSQVANGVNGNGRRVVETGNLRDLSRSRRTSVERGGRIAETGSLAGSTSSAVRNGSATTGNVSDSPVLGAFVPSLHETIE